MDSVGSFKGPIARCPAETLLSIFRFLTATDVFRLRQVSKQFRDLSYDIELWRSLYANACVPRPPGPFLWQTCDVLEDILLQSERLDRSWTSPKFKVAEVSYPTYLNCTRISFRTFQLDRLWLVRHPSYELVCYDVETELQSFVWKWDRPFTVRVCLDVSTERPTVFIFAIDRYTTSDAKLLMCDMNDDQEVLPVSACWDVPPINGARDGIIHFFSRMSTVYLGGDVPLIFDGTSCRFYQVPVQSASTVTPFFLRRTQLFWVDEQDFNLRFRVFTLPESGTRASPSDFESVPELRLTHEMIVPRDSSCTVSLLVYPPPGLVTESAQFKLLLRPYAGQNPIYECLAITFPGISPSLSNDVLSLSMQTQTLFTTNSPYDVLYVSHDGHARGFCEEGRWSDSKTDRKFQKFSIDASGDTCHAVVGKPTFVPFFEGGDDAFRMDGIDFVRGRAYCSRYAPFRTGTVEEWVVIAIE